MGKGGAQSVRLSGAKARSSWRWQTALVILSPFTRRLLARTEVTLVGKTLAQVLTREQPERSIGDRAYDSDPLDEELRMHGFEMSAPHCKDRERPAPQDGRPLRRYNRRWKIERLWAWLHNFRRVAMRVNYHENNYLGFVHIGCIKILLRCL